jgi:hypothetical protein
MVSLRCLGTLPPPPRYLVGDLEARCDVRSENASWKKFMENRLTDPQDPSS